MELLDEVRARMRIKGHTFDDEELSPLIAACRADLRRVGISATEDDPLARQAIVLYCKANFGFLEDSERFQRAYEALRDAMALCGPSGEERHAVP